MHLLENSNFPLLSDDYTRIRKKCFIEIKRIAFFFSNLRRNLKVLRDAFIYLATGFHASKQCLASLIQFWFGF